MSATYTLLAPVTVAGKTFTALTFRKMKAKDLAAADLVEGQTRKGLAILASMADVPLPVIMELDLEDIEEAQKVAAPFMDSLARAAEAMTAPGGE